MEDGKLILKKLNKVEEFEETLEEINNKVNLEINLELLSHFILVEELK